MRKVLLDITDSIVNELTKFANLLVQKTVSEPCPSLFISSCDCPILLFVINLKKKKFVFGTGYF